MPSPNWLTVRTSLPLEKDISRNFSLCIGFPYSSFIWATIFLVFTSTTSPEERKAYCPSIPIVIQSAEAVVGKLDLQHRPLAGVVVDQHSVIDVVHHPDLAFIRRQGDAMAGAAVSEEVLRSHRPTSPSTFGRGFDALDHLAGLHVGDFEAQQIIEIGIDARRVVIDHEGTNVIRERDRLDEPSWKARRPPSWSRRSGP